MGSDDKRWWDIISVACKPGRDEAAWRRGLQRTLRKLPADDILLFDRWFDDQAREAYTRNLWFAYEYITGYDTDDGFYYFRCWLIAQGKTIFTNAVANPDSLADVDTGEWPEAEIYGQARLAWAKVTGNSVDDCPVMHIAGGSEGWPKGEKWDYDNPAEVQRRYPRLFAKYSGRNRPA
jgi:Protein of unknown function (DUF4240)